MLDTDTKRRIDTARDILVGKVPDPKSQVEQITIALIYKFMHDMDQIAEENGGKRTFFTSDFARYAWPKLMSPEHGGQEVLNLYAEAIAKMPQNAGIPALFRDIFKNAFLPYRDPETLRLFLKEIDGFTYDHSERLGDAFEYLLSVLGSQGDAGQFRTPRHIIDFIVQLVDPKKTDRILDPACGTAGFLISAYKHIVAPGTKNPKKRLTPDELTRLGKNLVGYDISPDMVRLSLVNLYLHGFTSPNVEEYDTLTSEEHWNESFDVILANPPFMSPKGGIKPHNRFTVTSKRSEVLFVDYIHEHLSAHGKAGIIVPEGIIFQSQNTYKALRKMLVDESLVAVISLPAGVFQPYSGVKTSVLLLDKVRARLSDTVGFFKVTHDGFTLGAQRRESEKNDLPTVVNEIRQYFQAISNDEDTVDFSFTTGQIVAKETISENGDYNLSGERYSVVDRISGQFPLVSLGEVAEVIAGNSPPGSSYNEKGIGTPFHQGKTEFGSNWIGPAKKWTTQPQRMAKPGDILMSVRAPVGPVNRTNESLCIGRGLAAIRPDSGRVEPDYIFYMLRSQEESIVGDAGAAFASINGKDIRAINIPLPPLSVQRALVSEVSGYQVVIDGARAVLDNYRPHIAIDPAWPLFTLGELCKPEYGLTRSAKEVGDARFIRITDISDDGKLRDEGSMFVDLDKEAKRFLVKPGDLLVARTGATFGKTVLIKSSDPAVFASYLIRLRFSEKKLLPAYYWVFACSSNYWSQAESLVTGGGQPQFNGNVIKQLSIPVPPLKEQRALIDEISKEQRLVESNRKLITRMQQKIDAALARVWGEGSQ